MNQNQKKYLPATLTLYLGFTLLYSLSVPLWEAPDEPSHYLCVRRFSEGAAFKPPRYPGPFQGDWTEKYLYSLYQRSQPPLYYLTAAPAMRILAFIMLPPGQELKLPPPRPDFNREGNVFIHDRGSVWSIAFSETPGHLLRLFSVVLGCVTVFLIFRLGSVVFPEDPLIAFCSGAFAATLPQFNFISGVIGNDSMAALLGTATIFYLARRISPDRPARAGDFIFLGVLLLLSLSTKFNLIFLLPLALIFIYFKGRDSGGWRTVLLGFVLTFLPVALVGATAAALFPRVAALKIQILSFRLFRADPALTTLSHLWYMIRTISRSFFATFGWMSIPVGRWLYIIWGLICLAGVLGWVKALLHGIKTGENRKRQLILLTAGFIILLLAVMKNNLLVRQSQGRFLFPVLGAIAILLAAGHHYLFPEGARTRAAYILVGIFIALNLISFFGYLLPASYP